MENPFYHIRGAPLTVTFLLRTCVYYVNVDVTFAQGAGLKLFINLTLISRMNFPTLINCMNPVII